MAIDDPAAAATFGYLRATAAQNDVRQDLEVGRNLPDHREEGGLLMAITILHQPSSVYLASAKTAIDLNEIIGGLLKPTVFGFLIALIGCYKGLNTTGGTAGVGLATTQSVVVSSILIIAADFLLSKLLLTTILAQ